MWYFTYMSTVFANDFEKFLTKNKTNNLTYSLCPPASPLMRVSCDKLFAAQWDSEGETFYDSALKTQSGGGVYLNILN